MSDTVTVFIDSDEWYPVYSAEPVTEPDDGYMKWGRRVEVSREQAERWAAAAEAFDAAQQEMHAAWKAAE